MQTLVRAFLVDLSGHLLADFVFQPHRPRRTKTARHPAATLASRLIHYLSAALIASFVLARFPPLATHATGSSSADAVHLLIDLANTPDRSIQRSAAPGLTLAISSFKSPHRRRRRHGLLSLPCRSANRTLLQNSRGLSESVSGRAVVYVGVFFCGDI